jgi:glycosyltransferase involved in cell wall biosynthesis
VTAEYDLVCFSHLRWDFVYQRPQHLLSRFARARRVFFVEEPELLLGADREPRLDVSQRDPHLSVLVPRLPAGLSPAGVELQQRALLDEFFERAAIQDYVLWYYTPRALGFSRHLPAPLAVVYDCMDELSAFQGAPPELLLREAELFQRADLVFTGGQSLYEAKRRHHHSVHAFPSSVDMAHFRTARSSLLDPSDQAAIPHPRLGFAGVLDERLDIDLLANVADLRADWHLVLIGPTVKIDPADLPRRPNIHYLGAKAYAELPVYLAGWDVALIPFARNASTRYISPTKTPEYLAAGRPVVSTSIHDVVHPYATEHLVRIADKPDEFVEAVTAALKEERAAAVARSDAFLAGMSWDSTWAAMDAHVRDVVEARLASAQPRVAVAA